MYEISECKKQVRACERKKYDKRKVGGGVK